MEGEQASKIENDKPLKGLSSFQTFFGGKGSEFREFRRVEVCLLLTCWALLALMIAATQQTLQVAPYAPIAVVMILSTILWFSLSCCELTFWGLVTKRMIEQKSNDSMDIASNEDRKLLIRNICCSFPCFARTIGWIGALIMFWLIVSFLYPEHFFPTEGLVIRRLGSVTATSASLFIRDPQLKIAFVEYRELGDTSEFSTTPITTLEDSLDFATFIWLYNLTSNTTYEYRFGNTSTVRTFTTSPNIGEKSKYSFAFGSCFMYNFPYGIGGAPGFAYVEDMNPDFYLFVGDLIYADVPILLLGQESYFSKYRQLFRNPYFRSASLSIPSFHMWDDHEVFNDWDEEKAPPYDDAIENAWKGYVGNGNPKSTFTSNVNYFDFDRGDTSFFFVDTRFNRSDNKDPDSPTHTILGNQQKQDLLAWLLKVNSTAIFKFILCPVGVTIDFASVTDSFGGFSFEREEIFQFIRNNSISGVVFLTGDSHFAYAIELWYPGSGIYEFSASPWDAFDFTLGGYGPYSFDPWKPVPQRQERLLFSEIGQFGAVSFIGQVDVDTTAQPPFMKVSLWERQRLIYNLTLTIDQLRVT